MKIKRIRYIPPSPGGRAHLFYNVAQGGMMKGKIIDPGIPLWAVYVEMVCPDCGLSFCQKKETSREKDWNQWIDERCRACQSKHDEENRLASEQAEFEAEEKACSDGGKIDEGLKAIFGL